MNSITPRGTLRKSLPAQRGHASGPVVDDRVTEDRIRTRAYEIYLARNGNGGEGDATSDWLQAKKELSGAVPEPPDSHNGDSRSQARGEALMSAAT